MTALECYRLHFYVQLGIGNTAKDLELKAFMECFDQTILRVPDLSRAIEIKSGILAARNSSRLNASHIH